MLAGGERRKENTFLQTRHMPFWSTSCIFFFNLETFLRSFTSRLLFNFLILMKYFVRDGVPQRARPNRRWASEGKLFLYLSRYFCYPRLLEIKFKIRKKPRTNIEGTLIERKIKHEKQKNNNKISRNRIIFCPLFWDCERLRLGTRSIIDNNSRVLESKIRVFPRTECSGDCTLMAAVAAGKVHTAHV